MIDKRPKEWRQGQTIFNFLEWLNATGKAPSSQSNRMADPFHLQDEELEEMYDEFIELHEVKE